MDVSIIIPTYQRANDLQRLLESISNLISKPKQVLIVLGDGDKKSQKVAENWKVNISSLEVLKSAKASVIHSMNLGLSFAEGEIIVFLDDDAWVPTDWSLKIIKAFTNDEQLGAYGGRDRLQLNKDKLDNPPLAKFVGVFSANGSLQGNHHCGSLFSPVQVDVLKGVNLSFRRTAFKGMEIEPALEGFGAETSWEIDICQKIKQAGYKVLYDNENFVLHYIGQRAGYDNRIDIFSPSWPKRIYNQTLVAAKFRPAKELTLFILNTLLTGSRKQPGIIYSFFFIKKHGLKVLKLPWKNAVMIWKGLRKGLQIRKAEHNKIGNFVATKSVNIS